MTMTTTAPPAYKFDALRPPIARHFLPIWPLDEQILRRAFRRANFAESPLAPPVPRPRRFRRQPPRLGEPLLLATVSVLMEGLVEFVVQCDEPAALESSASDREGRGTTVLSRRLLLLLLLPKVVTIIVVLVAFRSQPSLSRVFECSVPPACSPSGVFRWLPLLSVYRSS